MGSVEISFVAVSVLYNFFFCITCWVIYQFLFHKTNLLTSKLNSGLMSAVIIFCVAFFTFAYDFLFSFFTDKTLQFPEITGAKRIYILILRGLLISGLYYFITYYLHVLSEKQKTSLEIAELKQAQLAANLFSLKEQLSPHFLFNTLNTLCTLTHEKNVKDYVVELANVYRYVLQYKAMDTATIRQELGFINSYLFIIKTRLESAIDVDIQVNESVWEAEIPPLTLQLLVENAIKHNVASCSKQLRIEIKNIENKFLVITNNLQPKNSVQVSTGIGLDNIMQRYQLLFNQEILIEKSPDIFTVKLPITCQT